MGTSPPDVTMRIQLLGFLVNVPALVLSNESVIDVKAISDEWKAQYDNARNNAETSCNFFHDKAEMEAQVEHLVKKFCKGDATCIIPKSAFREYIDKPDDTYFGIFKKFFPKLWETIVDGVVYDLSDAVEHTQIPVAELRQSLVENSCALINMLASKKEIVSAEDVYKIMEKLFEYGDIGWFLKMFARPLGKSYINKYMDCCDGNQDNVLDATELDCIYSKF